MADVENKKLSKDELLKTPNIPAANCNIFIFADDVIIKCDDDKRR